MSSRKQKNALLVPRLVKVHTSLTKIFSHKRQHFLVSGKLLIWSTREYLKLSPMSSSIPFTTQSNADVSKCFK